MLTMSGLQRALSCDGSLVLARARNHNRYADEGNDEHEDLSDFERLPPELRRLIPDGARAEVKVAYDVATGVGRIIGEGSGRSYGDLGPFEIAGSIDVLGVVDDAVVVRDWKGWMRVEPASTNAQAWGYALAAARALGKSRAIVGIIHAREMKLLWPMDEYEIDALELASFAQRLERLFARSTELQRRHKSGEQVVTNEGRWCKHCESKHVCSSKTALLIQLAGRGLSVVGDTTMTKDKAADAVREFQRAELMVKDAKARLTQYVDDNGPIDLGDGKLYGRYRKKGKERVDGLVAARAIREFVGESAKEFASVAIERSTSKAALERAAKAIGQPPRYAKRLVEHIRTLGGITQLSDEMPVGEFTDASMAVNESIDELEMADINRRLLEAG